MDQKKIDRILRFIREEMMTANAPGAQGGFGSAGTNEKGNAGYDKVMNHFKPLKRKKPQIIGKGKFPGVRKRWTPKKNES